MTRAYNPTDLANTNNWNLRFFREEVANIASEGSLAVIQDISIAMNYHALAIGCRSNRAKDHWYLGCWASMRVYAPGTSQSFSPLVEVESRRCGLNRLNLILFPMLYPLPYWLYLSFPKWMKHIYIEVWEYRGALTSDQPELLLPNLTASLSRLETKLDDLIANQLEIEVDLDQDSI